MQTKSALGSLWFLVKYLILYALLSMAVWIPVNVVGLLQTSPAHSLNWPPATHIALGVAALVIGYFAARAYGSLGGAVILGLIVAACGVSYHLTAVGDLRAHLGGAIPSALLVLPFALGGYLATLHLERHFHRRMRPLRLP